MRIEEVSCLDSRWDDYVLGHPCATGYHLIGWKPVMEDAFGHRTCYLMSLDADGQVRGVLPLVFVGSLFFGRFLVSLPFINYGGILVDTAASQTSLLNAAVERAKELRVSYIELRHEGLMDLEWPAKQHKVSMRLELPNDVDELWSRFPSKLRSQIRRAQKEGMCVRVGGDEILDDFYQVFSKNMRDLGTPVYGRNFFAQISKTFAKNTRIVAVYLQDRPLAAGFLYGFRRVLEIMSASSDRRYNRLAPNMLLYSSVLNYACQAGFRVFDFGRSTPGSGTYAFKEQWGARPVQLTWYYWLSKRDSPPDLSPSNPRYRLAVSAWQRLPLFVSQRLGPSISRSIP